jgi:uncharacterized membrane protein YoaK (UPF0700 family)
LQGSERESPAAAAARSVRHPLSRALLTLTITTGVVDAVSYLGLGHVFTANMTGNVVLLGFGIAGTGGLPVVAPLVSLIAFVAGSATGSVLSSRIGERSPVPLAAPIAVEVMLVGVAAVLAAAIDVRTGRVSGDAIIAVLAFAMGVRNAAVRRIGVPDLTTTVLTMTITALAAETPLAVATGTSTGTSAARRSATVRRSAAVLTMLGGAVAGALLLKTSIWLALTAAAALSLLTLISYVRAQATTDPEPPVP